MLFDELIYNNIYSIEEVRQDLKRVVDYFKSMDYHTDWMESTLIKERKLPWEIINQCEAFFIEEEITISQLPEWMLQEPLGLVRYKTITQSGRVVYPVKDVLGQVMGFCGWDPFVEPKYLDSKNYGYKAKQYSFYGMEKLEEYYKSSKPVFVVEGIVDCLYLRSLGFQAIALLGSNFTFYVKIILDRFGSRLIMIPDNDEAGNSLVIKTKRLLKKATIVQVKYGKDIDGCRKLDEGKYEEDLKKDLLNLSNPFSSLNILLRA